MPKEEFEWIPLPVEIDELLCMGEAHIKTATHKDWENYPAEARRHTERNNPRFIEFLIRRFSKMGGRIHDPQCGIGTVMHEASWLGRVATGWDIRERWRKIVQQQSKNWLMFDPDPDSISLVITSPSYFNMNHSLGKSEKQKAVRRRLRSDQGTEMEKVEDMGMQDISSTKTMAEWMIKTARMYSKINRMLRSGGRLAIIIREKVKNQKPEGLVPQTIKNVESSGLKYVGYYYRRLLPAGTRRLQGKKFFDDTGLNPVYPDREYALIFKKVR